MAFRKILIANRGEIAVRINATAQRLGYRTVAIYSDADAGAPHVRDCDEAVRIGPPSPADSYLDAGRILRAAAATGADALHPGYGFLSENPDFAAACAGAGLVFIGPSVAAIRLMGNKAAAKRHLATVGVAGVPGYEGEDQSDETLTVEAARIGYPVMVKAAAGGGGRGLRRVDGAKGLRPALRAARSEAENAFGSPELILERALADPRHVEIQIFGDTHGNVVHLGDRDCSVQRRHQKVIEEAPSPALDPALREAMGAVAVAVGRAIDYVGAGTVEFLLEEEGRFYFLEMNTRLQVEHPVTELVTGLDLVAWQLEVAGGAPLPLAQAEIRHEGHAIEARLYAEDPSRGFLPRTGTLIHHHLAAGEGVRWDHGLADGQAVTADYDPLLAKVTAHGRTREEARRRLRRALEGTALLGVTTNREFLCDLLDHPAFAAGAAATTFVDRTFEPRRLARPDPGPGCLALAAALIHERGHGEPDGLLANWRSTGPAPAPMALAWRETRAEVTVTAHPRHLGIEVDGDLHDLVVSPAEGNAVRYTVDGIQRTARFAFDAEGALYLQCGGATECFRDVLLRAPAAGARGGDGRVVAPMNGRVISVDVAVGDAVTSGQRVLVIEAMKMQHEVTVTVGGTVVKVMAAVGDQVAARAPLLELDPDAA